jgi:Peptidase family S41
MRNILGLLFTLSSLTLFGQSIQVPLTTEQRLKELNILKATFTSLHPGLYRFNTPAKIDNYFEVLKQKISNAISNEEYFILLSKLTTILKCGHTYLNPWNQNDEVINNYFSKSFIPFLYKIIDGKFIITHNLSENKNIQKGDEIVSINGVKVIDIIDSLLIVSRTDGNNGLGKKMDNLNIVPIDIDLSNYSLFDIYFPLYFPENFNASNYDFVIKPFKGRAIRTTLKSLTKEERQGVYVSMFGEIPLHEKNWEFKFLNSNAAYLRLGDFETWEWKADYKNYLDSVFTIIHNSTARNLIIDIRGNEGGDNEARTEVLSYLVNKPFGCDNPMRRLYKFLSIPDTLLPYLKTWNKEFKKPKKESDYRKTADGYYEKIDTSETPCTPTLPKESIFKGNTFLLTNSNNSSTTFTLADIFKQTNSGKIIGEATGGTKQGLNGGQFFFLNLPYSKFEIDIPIIWGAPTHIRPDEGIKPDIEIRTNQKDIYYGIDTQLQFILSQIAK